MKKLRIDECFGEDFIFSEILPKLSIKSLMRFKSVSKSWLAYISSDSFIADHFHRHSTIENLSQISRVDYRGVFNSGRELLQTGFDYPIPVGIDMSDTTKAQSEKIKKFCFCGISNGLIFIQQFYDNKRYNLLLWNPATKEFKNLPTPIGYRKECIGSADHRFGFGKDCNNYKVVRIARKVYRAREIGVEVQLLSRNSGCWKKHGVLSDFKILKHNNMGGVVIGDFVHWPVLSGEEPVSGTQYKILTFDLNTEELKVNNGPIFGSDAYNYPELFNWKNTLCASAIKVYGRREFWLKNKDTWCWTKFIVSIENYLFQGVFRDQFLLKSFNSGQKDILFDPVTKAQTFFYDEIKCFGRLNFQHYLPSLVSPSFKLTSFH